MQLIDSKSLLAKLMATENLIVEQRPVSTACFDVKNRILTVPVLDKNIPGFTYDLFMGHEVGHALYTPLDGMIQATKQKVNMGIVNVVEDCRIERKIKYKYPGLKNSFVKAYNDLMEKNFFETKDVDLNELNFIDRINLHTKVGAALQIKFTDFERDLLTQVEKTESYDDVVEVSKRIEEYMKKQQEEKQKRKEPKDQKQEVEDIPDSAESSGNKSNESEEEKEEKKQKAGEKEDSGEEQNRREINGNSDKDGEEADSDETEESEKKTGESTRKDAQTQQSQQQEEIRSYTDDAFHKNEKQLFVENSGEFVYANIPKIDLDKSIFDYKDLWKRYEADHQRTMPGEFKRLRKESDKVVSYLVKEFEMRKNADQMKRATVAKSGDLNMNKIFSYQFNEDLFKKSTVIPGGKSHGLVMFLDWSGSMADHISNTTKQLINLVLFCKKVNIPYEVYAFTEHTLVEYMNIPNRKDGDLALEPYGLLNLLSSRMTAKEFNYAAAALVQMSGIGMDRRVGYMPSWMYMQGTPLNEAIIAAMEIVPHFQKKNKLQMVNTVFLTDGDGRGIMEVYSKNEFNGSIQRVNGIYSKNKTVSNFVLRDPVSKHQEIIELSKNRYDFFRNQTPALIRLLKARTDCNILGFYVISGRDFNRKVYDFYPNSTIQLIESVKDKFRKENCAILTDTGFDEYYVLRSSALDTDDDNVFEVKENATTKGLVNAFSKYTGNRIANRAVLNRFIGMIA